MRKGPRLSPEELRPYTVELPPYRPDLPPPPAEPFDWAALFGNANPVEVEIGFGKGLFLVNEGAAHPEVNYFGVEIVRKYQLFAANRLARRGLRNVKVACADARPVMRDRIAGGSVRTVYLHFPDPWWKSKHHKRRVFTPELAAQCERVLEPGGRLVVVTDVPDYAAMVRETVAGHTGLVEAPPPVENEPRHDMDYLTNFERKFRQQGKPIHRMAFARGA